MVFKIELNLFESEENDVEIDILINYVLNRRYDIYIDDENIFESHWAQNSRKRNVTVLKEALTSTITSSRTIDLIITENENDFPNKKISLQNALILFDSKLEIYLENASYDSLFIKSLINNFKKKAKKINFHLTNRWIEFKHCGGKNDIINQLNTKMNTLSNLDLESHLYLRAIIIIDSDKKSEDDNNPNRLDTINSIINFCNEKNFLIHILEKREIENYLPIDILENCIEKINKSKFEELKSLSQNERDYFDYGELKTREFNTKQEIPNLFLNENVTQDKLVHICSHQKDPNELQNILDLINSKL